MDEARLRKALIEALRVRPADPPRDPQAWLVTVAWHRFLDAIRADAAAIDHPEAAGLLALMLLHHARRAGRTPRPAGRVPYAEAARKAPNLAERDYLTRRAARLNTRRDDDIAR